MQIKGTLLPRPPGLVATLTKGFDKIANHIWVIILPVILDLFLWLGPKLRVQTLLQPLLEQMSNLTAAAPSAASQLDPALVQEMYSEFLAGFNLLGALRTFPLGVVSLMSSNMPAISPLGQPASLEVSNFPSLLTAWIGLAVMGWLMGSLYYYWISGITSDPINRKPLEKTFLQGALLSLTWFAAVIVVGAPLALIFSFLIVLIPSIGQIAIFMLVLMGIWLLMPVFFSPHGIFLYGQNALESIKQSLRVIRYTLPSSGTFLLVCVLINEGLGYLWTVPPQESWLTLVAILGHAFVSTALIAATFIYFREINLWLTNVLEQIKKRQEPETPGEKEV